MRNKTLPGFVWCRVSEKEESFARELGAESPEGIGLWSITPGASFLIQTNRRFSAGACETSMKFQMSYQPPASMWKASGLFPGHVFG